MNTDTVEWFFGDARQMVGGSTNKLTVAGFERASKKASTFNAAKFSLVGNNAQEQTCLVEIRDFSCLVTDD